MDDRVKAFFVEYERANSTSDLSAMGRLYADTFMFAGTQGVQAVRRQEFLAILPTMKQRFAAMGVSGTELHTVDAKPLDPRYFLATADWKVNLPAGKHVEATATYILAGVEGDALTIVFQMDHQDLASVIEDRLSPGK